MAYPGPLGQRETRWSYADGLALESSDPLEEREWVSVLNPDPTLEAQGTIRWSCAGRIWSRRGEHGFSLKPSRLQVVELSRLADFPKNRLCGVTVESSSPVVVSQVRRAYRRGEDLATALWVTLAQAHGDQPID